MLQKVKGEGGGAQMSRPGREEEYSGREKQGGSILAGRGKLQRDAEGETTFHSAKFRGKSKPGTLINREESPPPQEAKHARECTRGLGFKDNVGSDRGSFRCALE